MKKVFKGLFLVTGIMLILGSCKKKEDEDPVYAMSARVNGAPWFTNSVSCMLLIDTVNNFRVVNFTSTYSSKRITVEFFDNGSGNSIQTESHFFTDGDAFFNYSEGSEAYQVLDGDVTVTYNDASLQTISGGFDFTVRKIDGGNDVHISLGGLRNVGYTVKYQ